MKRTAKVSFKIREAEALLQLAQEADYATFDSTTDSEEEQKKMCDAADIAIAKLKDALFEATGP